MYICLANNYCIVFLFSLRSFTIMFIEKYDVYMIWNNNSSFNNLYNEMPNHNYTIIHLYRFTYHIRLLNICIRKNIKISTNNAKNNCILNRVIWYYGSCIWFFSTDILQFIWTCIISCRLDRVLSQNFLIYLCIGSYFQNQYTADTVFAYNTY